MRHQPCHSGKGSFSRQVLNKERVQVTSMCVGVDIMKRYLGVKCLTVGEERGSLSTHSSYVLTALLNVGAGSTYGFCVTGNIWLGTV